MPEGSLLLELPEIRAHGRAVRRARAMLPLAATPTARLDALCAAMQETIKREERRTPRRARFSDRSGTWPRAASSR